MRWFLRLIGPSVSGGRNRSNLGTFYDQKIIEKDEDGKSDAEYFYAVAGLVRKALPPASAPDLWVSDQERKEAKELLSEIPGEGPLVLIHPGCDRETRRWFPQRFAAVALQLCDRRHARIAIVGGQRDWPIAVEVEQLARPGRVRALPYLRSIGVLAAMIEQADLLISNNSMAMHVAGATKIPCIAICASGDVARDRPPWRRDRMELLWKPLECSPCYYRRCPRQYYMECMEHISVEEVVETSEKFLMRSALA
jgi:heptosyltransferase-2